jgi:hypothetical protein
MKRHMIPVGLVGVLTILTAGAAVLAIHDVGRTRFPSSTHLRSTGSPLAAKPLTQPGGTTVKIVKLSHEDLFDDLHAAHGRLQLTGVPNSALNDLQSSPCLAAHVDERALAVGPVMTENCNDPSTVGEKYEAVVTPVSDHDSLAVSISHVNPSTGQLSVSAPLMLCNYSSDTQPVTTYGGGSIWVYDVATTFGAIAIQVSAMTGVLEDTVVMPKLYRPLMAADGDGLWIANSIEGSPSPDVIYHVAPGSKVVTGLVQSLAPGERPRSSLTAQWITASGDHVWAGIGTNLTRETIWRFDGAAAKVVFKVPDRGFDPFEEVVGNLPEGLFTEVPYPKPRTAGPYAGPTYEEILEIDPANGSEKVVATLPPLPALEAEIGPRPDQMVVVGGSLYVLQPPFFANRYLGYSELVKVTPG